MVAATASAIQRYRGSEIGESPRIGGSRGSLVNGSRSPIPVGLRQNTPSVGRLLCCSGNRLELSASIEQATLGSQFLVLWSANDREGEATSWACHGPTAYLYGAVAVPQQPEWWHFLGRVFSGACWWPLVAGLTSKPALTSFETGDQLSLAGAWEPRSVDDR